MKPPAPLDPDKQPPTGRYCDVVLTGGVTDGVIYPWAVIELAREYRFKNIGGTSVGAMAAALTAAAEYRRRDGYLTGFNDVLMKVPEKLGEPPDDSGPPVDTTIFSLFQPAKGTQRLFDLCVELFSSGGTSVHATATMHTGRSGQEGAASPERSWTRTMFHHFRMATRVYRLAGLLGGLVGVLFLVAVIALGWEAWSALPPWHFAALILVLALLLTLPVMLLFGTGLIVRGIYRDVTGGLVPNGFGLCTGGHVNHLPPDRLSLVEWLHKGVQAAAGRRFDRPLTFEDLWDAPGGPDSRQLPSHRRKRPKSIDLRMITTNLTHGRPYEFPLDNDSTRLFFDPGELQPFFPAAVIAHLVEHSQPYDKCRLPGDPAPSKTSARLRELPREKLPIVVAARLSLSFPFLFSAVPLWAIDHEPTLPEDQLRRCRFSDGGICSNFPIHMFDAAVPEWPTFGISLGPRNVFRKDEPLWLPWLHGEGRDDNWFRFDDEKAPEGSEPVPAVERLLGFASAILYSAKDWNDKTAMRMPGVRDRVVRVALASGSGGLNLKITKEEIDELASEYGQPAGRKLVEKFIDRAQRQPSKKWDEHRWVRFNTFLTGLRERIELLAEATELPRYGTPLSQAIPAARQTRPLEGTDEAGKTLRPEQAQDLQALLAALKALEAAFAQASWPQPYKPDPEPNLQIRAPL